MHTLRKVTFCLIINFLTVFLCDLLCYNKSPKFCHHVLSSYPAIEPVFLTKQCYCIIIYSIFSNLYLFLNSTIPCKIRCTNGVRIINDRWEWFYGGGGHWLAREWKISRRAGSRCVEDRILWAPLLVQAKDPVLQCQKKTIPHNTEQKLCISYLCYYMWFHVCNTNCLTVYIENKL